MPEPETGAAELRWEVRRPPRRGPMVFAWCAAIPIVAFCAWFAATLDPQQRHWPGAVFGVILALVLVRGLSQGTRAAVDVDGHLLFGYGRRHNLAVPLAATADWRWVEGPGFAAPAADCDLREVTFLDRRAVSYARMRRWKRDLGAELVLEGLTAEDLARIRALHRDAGGARETLARSPGKG